LCERIILTLARWPYGDSNKSRTQKAHIRGFIHSESSTGQTVYIEPEETLDLNNDIISLSFAERREIERILRELTKDDWINQVSS
jgi:dsDNA-specific endonuclease/ATPase MutS2